MNSSPDHSSDRAPLAWSYSSLGAPAATLPELFGWAADHGLAGVELRTVEGSVDMPTILARAPGGPAGVRAAAAAQGLRVSGLDTSFKLYGWKDEDWASLLAWAEAAEAVGAPALRVFDGGAVGEIPGRAEQATAAAFLHRWRAERASRGWQVEVAIETHDVLVTIAARDALRQVAGPVPWLWDTHHTWKKGGEDLLVSWVDMRDDALAVHIKDSIPVPSARHPFTYVTPGAGEFPARTILAELEQAHFPGWVVFEWERQWHPYLDPVEQALPALATAGWR